MIFGFCTTIPSREEKGARFFYGVAPKLRKSYAILRFLSLPTNWLTLMYTQQAVHSHKTNDGVTQSRGWLCPCFISHCQREKTCCKQVLHWWNFTICKCSAFNAHAGKFLDSANTQRGQSFSIKIRKFYLFAFFLYSIPLRFCSFYWEILLLRLLLLVVLYIVPCGSAMHNEI